MKPRLLIGLSTASLAVIGAGVWLSGVLSNVAATCELTGSGFVRCEFQNRGLSPGATCVRATLKREDSATLPSDPICSFRLWPRQRQSVEIAPFMNVGGGSAINFCINKHKLREEGIADWRGLCTFVTSAPE